VSDWFKKEIMRWLIRHADQNYTPKLWCELLGVRILDWDGWRDKDVNTPIELTEFLTRYQYCTVEG
jgi:hypothetical protein